MAKYRANTVLALLGAIGLTASMALGTIVIPPAAGGAVGLQASASVDGQPVERSQPEDVGCDYEELYGETIDSIVSIRRLQGLGSGFVYRTANRADTSLIVTNAHVVGDAATVTIEFKEGEFRQGTVVGTDRLTDIAVVRVADTPTYVESLPVAESIPDPGRNVAALGNPFGLEETITAGIISGTNRSLPTTGGFTLPHVLQTDAAISPGNSGGPLITCDGTVVGVNTAGIAARRAENIGFAVPATVLNEVVPDLIEDGEAEHAYLGVSVVPIVPPIAQANESNVTNGVFVVSVAPKSPAARELRGATGFENVSGINVPTGGDVILSIEGRRVGSPGDRRAVLLTEVDPGETVTVTIIRNGERRAVRVTLTDRPKPGTD